MVKQEQFQGRNPIKIPSRLFLTHCSRSRGGEEMEGRSGIPALLADGGGEHIASDITQLIGWTPLIELKQIVKKEDVDVRLVAKLESYQPLSSVKDRSALRMIEDAEEKGLISPGINTLLEPTSGNLGIALASIGIQKGYRFAAVMPAQYSLDKQILLRYLGADVYLTDPQLGLQGMLDKTEELKQKDPNIFVPSQFDNPANQEAHFISTGPEIWKDTAGKVDILVIASGSGGTLSGTGKYLKMKKPDLKIFCVEPSESAVISGGSQGKHSIQGIGPGLIPPNLDTSCIDEVITVTTEEAMTLARRVAREEGLLVGISSGANIAACLKVAGRAESKGKMIVTIFPSDGERYKSSVLFAEVREECEKMTF